VEESVTAITQRMEELQQSTQGAVEQSKQTGIAAVAEILETHGMLRSDTTALFERLREANELIREVLSGAQDNLFAIEQTLSSRFNQFLESMNLLLSRTSSTTDKVSDGLGSFQDITGKVLSELGDVAMQFDRHGRLLSAMLELVEGTSRRTEEAVTERQQELDNAVTALDTRTEAIDLRLKQFSGLLEESLVAAEARANDIVRLVAEVSAQGADVIADHHQRIRAASDEERQRTMETLHGVYEQASNETHALFQQTASEAEAMLQSATDRFSDVLQSVRQMSAAMQRDLEGAREELRRGIFQLPQETTDIVGELRRVIVDQIEALAELNQIVARHGRNIDATTTEPARRIYREEPLLASVSGGRHEAPPPRQMPPVEHLEPPAAPPPPHRAEALAPENDKTRGGWLSDLLSRASRDNDEEPEPEEQPARGDGHTDERLVRHTIESLDSLSVDISHMIDHDAAAELWDRYNRGEHNVFTRQLYTIQGQKTFEEIRRRYHADRDFKDTVDRYIDEFEQLLEQVSRNDRGRAVASTYLTSETGKVYTMLAHAAGRLG